MEPIVSGKSNGSENSPSLVIITGLSGAGKSTAMRVFDDLGYYCLDNLPPALILDFYHLYMQGSGDKNGVAIASDMRSGELFADFQTTVQTLKQESITFAIVYLECSSNILINRYKETRRSHPLEGHMSIREAIDEERHRLSTTLALATTVIDTSRINAMKLRQTVLKTVIGKDASNVPLVKISSFGFKYGAPRDADYIFDVRFLPNPFYVENLRLLCGEDDDVYNYVMNDEGADRFFHSMTTLLTPTFDSFVNVGKFTIHIAIGCTGGRHRSVAFAKRLFYFFKQHSRDVALSHRDMAHPH